MRYVLYLYPWQPDHTVSQQSVKSLSPKHRRHRNTWGCLTDVSTLFDQIIQFICQPPTVNKHKNTAINTCIMYYKTIWNTMWKVELSTLYPLSDMSLYRFWFRIASYHDMLKVMSVGGCKSCITVKLWNLLNFADWSSCSHTGLYPLSYYIHITAIYF